jgi:hypothetical protein
MTTQQSGGVPGEKRSAPVETEFAERSSGMNELRESRSSIHIAPARSTPLRKRNKSMHRNGCTLLLPRDRTASPYFQNRIQLYKSNSYRFGFSPSIRSFPRVTAQER